MLTDVLSVILRALSFVSMLQAAGVALFAAAFGRRLSASAADIRSLGVLAAIGAAPLLTGHYALEAARLAGDLSGTFDVALQSLVLGSTSSVTLALRLIGLFLIAVGLRRGSDMSMVTAVIGATLIVTSFILTGHASDHPDRWLLASLLVIHLLIAAFWLGSLVGLHRVILQEAPQLAATIVEAFSHRAVRIVPGLLAAGVAAAFLLLPGIAALREPYGMLLLAKLCGFMALMALAAVNRWRLAPAMSRGVPEAGRKLRRSMEVEWVLIAGVLALTAVMTTFFSP